MSADHAPTRLTDLPSIGPVVAQHLQAVGLATPEQFRQAGAQQAFERIRAQRDPSACLHMLYGLAAAELGVAKKDLPADRRTELRTYFRDLPSTEPAGTEPNATKSAGTEPDQTEPDRTGPNRTRPDRTELTRDHLD